MGKIKRDICDYRSWRKVTEFSELGAIIRGVLVGETRFAIIQAGSGLGKSATVTEEIARAAAEGYPKPIEWGKGLASAFGMYCQLAEFPNHPVIADDFDFALAKDEVRGLLRAFVDSQAGSRRVTWTKKTPEGIPQSVHTESSMILVANEIDAKRSGMPAILNRAVHRVRFAPPPKTLQLKAAKWASVQEVFDFWSRALCFMSNPNQRCLNNAQTIYGSSTDALDWRDAIVDDADYVGIDQVEVFKAWASGRHASKADLFRSLGEGAPSRPTTYRWLKDWDAEIQGRILTGLQVEGAVQTSTLRLVVPTTTCASPQRSSAPSLSSV